MLRKSQLNFQHYVKKIEAQAKNGFLKYIKKISVKFSEITSVSLLVCCLP